MSGAAAVAPVEAHGGDGILAVDGLSISFRTDSGIVRVVDDVAFKLMRGQTLGLVGESGCGKSVTAQTLMRLLPMPPASIDSGTITLDGENLVTASEQRLRALRGDRIAMIFQEPMTSLNPVFTVGEQIAEALRLHRRVSRGGALAKAAEALVEVGIGSPERRLAQYPHELSGGLRQRVMIAMALVCRPAVLIADEPTTALDVTVQAQILELLKRIQSELGLAILLITHDLGVVAELCEEVAVMYAGRIVEAGKAADVLARPRHPYTAGLLNSSPRKAQRGQRLTTIPGTVPPPGSRGAGCSFAGRCSRAQPRCTSERPDLTLIGGHFTACWNPVP